MVYGMHKKIKVAWICHFSNEKVRGKLPLTNKRKYGDFSPWITNTLQAMQGNNELELHVISPHRGLKKLTYSFYEDNIHYYFFKPDLPIIHKMWPYYFPLDKWSGYFKNKIIVHKIINDIKPDLINLHGAENPYYSSTILGEKDYPVYVCIQGIYSDPEHLKHVKFDSMRIKIERKIMSEFKYYGIRAPFMNELINEYNPNAITFLQFYPIIVEEIEKIKRSKQIYDYVYFARITKAKGIEDLIDAIKIIKQFKPNVTLNIIGPGDKKYIQYLKEKTIQLGIMNNIIFSGYYETMEKLHSEVVKARISVLPTKADTIPGTIIESIKLGLPVVSYSTGGIPLLNNEGRAVLLCDKGDIRALAKNMIKVLEDQNLANELIQKAQKAVNRYFNNEQNVSNLIKQYKAIIDHYNSGGIIENNLLFTDDLFNQMK